MFTKYLLLVTAVFALMPPAPDVQRRFTSPNQLASTYYVQGATLYDTCGEKVILRGVNHPTMWVDRQGKAMPEIAKTGANTVRLFWYAGSGVPISAVEPAIKAAIANKMVPILEMHDSTCAWKLDKIVRYWTSREAVALISKYENQLIVNLANEPSPPSALVMYDQYRVAVRGLRNAGIVVPIMLDAGDCGRDYEQLLQIGSSLLGSDPAHSLIFSVHLYKAMDAEELADLFWRFKQARLLLVVGEFATNTPPGCGEVLDYKAIMSQAQKSGVGWLAWSWGDNDPSTRWNSDCAEFDMTETFAFASLRGWGKEVAVTHPDSIANTSKRSKSMQNKGVCR